jgi:hypothetical protein
MQRPRPTEARDVGAALDDRLVPGSSVDRWGLVAEGAVPSAVVVVRLPVADHHPRLKWAMRLAAAGIAFLLAAIIILVGWGGPPAASEPEPAATMPPPAASRRGEPG